ncbi:hypothetical protein [Streptomyces wuyuanensis]|uniref:hypothetical protein n=1 Tax=Streptomyces wuyuanensis TaxID=1196353 RepID=UPI00342DADF7
MPNTREHSAQVVREHVAAHTALSQALADGGGELEAEAVRPLMERRKAADAAHRADLEARGFAAPYGLTSR